MNQIEMTDAQLWANHVVINFVTGLYGFNIFAAELKKSGAQKVLTHLDRDLFREVYGVLYEAWGEKQHSDQIPAEVLNPPRRWECAGSEWSGTIIKSDPYIENSEGLCLPVQVLIDGLEAALEYREESDRPRMLNGFEVEYYASNVDAPPLKIGDLLFYTRDIYTMLRNCYEYRSQQ